MNFFENITIRRMRTKSDSNTVTNDTISNSTFEDTVSSLPDISNDDFNEAKQEQQKLKEQIDKLVLDLNSAHQEIESLSLENSNLRQLNSDLQRKNELFTKLNSPFKKPKKSTPMKKCLNKNKSSQTEPLVIPNQEKEKKSHRNEIPKIAKQTLHNHSVIPTIGQGTTQNIHVDKTKLKSNLCIFSTNKTNKNILSLTEEYFQDTYHICHYLTPNVSIMQLLRDIQTKLRNYTINDFCIIMIGEEDFKTTKCYYDIIRYIRNALQDIKNTNIIITLPTFKYNNDYNILYNSRVEMFNNMLYMDIITHQYAYTLDSNLNLSYEQSAYTRLGALKNHTMRTIFEDLFNLQLEILEENTLNAHKEPKEQFFLE